MNGLYYCDWHEVYTTNLAIAVAQHSHEVSVIVREAAPEFQGRKADAEDSRRRLLDGISELHVLPGKYWSLKSLKRIRRILASERRAIGRFDYFHIQQTNDPRFLWVAARLPTVLTLHEPRHRRGETRNLSPRKALAPAIQRAYQFFANVLVVHTDAQFQQLSPRDRRKAVVIPHGVRPSSFQTPLKPTAKTILFFGRAARYKGIHILLAAMGEVWKADPSARLQILASRGHPECEVHSFDNRVTASWDGYSESDLDAALASAHVVCLPYMTASGTGVGTRAYGAGKALVASNLEGLREFVSDPQFLFEPGDVEDLARALISAISRDCSPCQVEYSTTWPAVAATYISRYESIL